MAWNYSGNPVDNELDKYRFLIGDTIKDEPILQDEEIQYILNTYSNHIVRLYHLYDRAADIFARKVSRSLGPQSENTAQRQRHFEEKAAYYRKLLATSGFPSIKSIQKTFSKGMHDNV